MTGRVIALTARVMSIFFGMKRSTFAIFVRLFSMRSAGFSNSVSASTESTDSTNPMSNTEHGSKIHIRKAASPSTVAVSVRLPMRDAVRVMMSMNAARMTEDENPVIAAYMSASTIGIISRERRPRRVLRISADAAPKSTVM